jgi:hypothetical protein
MSCEVRASGGSTGPLVVTASTWRGEHYELWSSGTGGVLGRRPLVPGGARRQDQWVVARWRLAAWQDTDDSGGYYWGLQMVRNKTQPSRVWVVVGLGCGLWRIRRRGGSTWEEVAMLEQ